MKFKFTARKIDEIEKIRNMPIANIMQDMSISNLALLIQKCHYDDNDGTVGLSSDESFDMLDYYLRTSDIVELQLDIMDEMVKSGFLPRTVNVQQIRESMQNTLSNL